MRHLWKNCVSGPGQKMPGPRVYKIRGEERINAQKNSAQKNRAQENRVQENLAQENNSKQTSSPASKISSSGKKAGFPETII